LRSPDQVPAAQKLYILLISKFPNLLRILRRIEPFCLPLTKVLQIWLPIFRWLLEVHRSHSDNDGVRKFSFIFCKHGRATFATESPFNHSARVWGSINVCFEVLFTLSGFDLLVSSISWYNVLQLIPLSKSETREAGYRVQFEGQGFLTSSRNQLFAMPTDPVDFRQVLQKQRAVFIASPDIVYLILPHMQDPLSEFVIDMVNKLFNCCASGYRVLVVEMAARYIYPRYRRIVALRL
jgi:hypothetical protein